MEHLDALRHDVSETKARIREALDELAERHGIRASDVAYAMEGYADDLLSDAVYNVERELEQEIESEDPP
jgi:cell division ATPase FtsA